MAFPFILLQYCWLCCAALRHWAAVACGVTRVVEPLVVTDGDAVPHVDSTACGFCTDVGVLPSLGEAAQSIPTVMTAVMLAMKCELLAMCPG